MASSGNSLRLVAGALDIPTCFLIFAVRNRPSHPRFVELGASWIISWMQRLDQAHRAFRRLQDLSELKMRPSEYVRRQAGLMEAKP